MSTPTNRERFRERLVTQYTALFQLPQYAGAAHRFTPKEFADLAVRDLPLATFSKDGEAVRAVCALLGVKNTYKAIREYLNAPNGGRVV